MYVSKKNVLSFSGNKEIKEKGLFLVVDGHIMQESNGTLIKVLKQGSVFHVDPEGASFFQYFSRGKCFLLEIEDEKYLEEIAEENIHRLAGALERYRLPARQRVEALVYQIALDIGVESENEIYIPISCNQSELARYSNVSREYFVKIKNDLLMENMIAIRNRNWVLLDKKNWETRPNCIPLEEPVSIES
ncbi:hypothetical protein MFLO_00515 [Listeria floridensis FSL S10-1187]|uniref:Crp/Fnr family transcriptional regulator n=1 Tax=Listeria floridensis FSL S10-1187 TaxID=1265817 RepID=A0ABP3B3M6_9LIST|nr:Crp/Fnr family transcriptional regulator [Listeria floridensis]EUJ33687.1 hypothetical protein MFLO_00515 [Listeria floridensis FSL S10-1187]